MPLNYAGPHGLLAGDSMSLRFFHKLGATQLFRRAMCGGVRSEAWVGTYGAVPGIGPDAAGTSEAERRLGQQRDRHQPASRAPGSHRAAAGRPPGRHRPDGAARSRSRPTCIWRSDPGTDVSAGICPGRRTGTPERPRPAFHQRTCAGLRRIHAGRPRLAGGHGCRRRAACRWNRSAHWPRGWPRPTRWSWRPATGWSAAATAAAACGAAIALPALLGKLNATSGIVLGAGYAFPKTAARLTRPDLHSAGHPHA